MKQFRVWMMAALLASATSASAMTPPVPSLQALLVGLGQQSSEADDLANAPASPGPAPECEGFGCPLAGGPCWLSQTVRQTMSVWQRLRAVCFSEADTCSARAACCKETCGQAAVAKSPPCCKAASCATGAAGCVTGQTGCCKAAARAAAVAGSGCQVGSCRAISQCLGEAASCCCAKACACCETCKTKQEAVPRQQAECAPSCCPAARAAQGACQSPPMVVPCVPPMQSMVQGHWVLPASPQSGWAPPPPMVLENSYGNPVPMHAPGFARVIAVPTAGMAMPQVTYQVIRPQVAAAPSTQQAHLVTPDLEAHCERMTHSGDVILLEGDVRLTSRKNGRPLRIEAHRVIVNMNDGSFTVESDAKPVKSSTSAVLRTSVVEDVRVPQAVRIIDGKYIIEPDLRLPVRMHAPNVIDLDFQGPITPHQQEILKIFMEMNR